jgi:expansin
MLPNISLIPFTFFLKFSGGACGYGSLVDVVPYKARVGAVSPVLFKGGEGCGACYKVRCLDPSICSRRAVTIIVTDECPGGYCSSGKSHFDLSGAAFSRMAVAGHGPQLRNRGEISVVFRRYENRMLV